MYDQNNPTDCAAKARCNSGHFRHTGEVLVILRTHPHEGIPVCWDTVEEWIERYPVEYVRTVLRLEPLP